MCIGLPGRVVELGSRPGIAAVEIGGSRKQVNIALLDGLAPGDWILVHMGFALQQVEEKDALETLRLLQANDPQS